MFPPRNLKKLTRSPTWTRSAPEKLDRLWTRKIFSPTSKRHNLRRWPWRHRRWPEASRWFKTWPPWERWHHSLLLSWILNNGTRLPILTYWSSLLRPRWTVLKPRWTVSETLVLYNFTLKTFASLAQFKFKGSSRNLVVDNEPWAILRVFPSLVY